MTTDKQKDTTITESERDTIIIKMLFIILGIFVVLIGFLMLVLINVDVDFGYYGEYELTVDENHVLENGENAEIIWDESTLSACNEKFYDYYLKEIDFSKEAYLVSHGKPIERINSKLIKTTRIYSEWGRVLYVEYEEGDFPLKDYIYIFDTSKGRYCTESERIYVSY